MGPIWEGGQNFGYVSSQVDKSEQVHSGHIRTFQNRQTDMNELITFPQLRWRVAIKQMGFSVISAALSP